MALVEEMIGFFLYGSPEEMIVGRWYVQLAAIWHWYLRLCIYITFLFLDCVCPFLFLKGRVSLSD